MLQFPELSIKSRLLMILLPVSLVSILVVGLLSWQSSRNALEQSIKNQLTSIRVAKANQIESYFDSIFRQVRMLAEDRMVVQAMNNFSIGYQEGVEKSLSNEEYQTVRDFYETQFMPRLANNLTESPPAILYHPQRVVANYFQYHYTVSNPYPVGQKAEFVFAETDSSSYARFHQTYHPLFRKVAEELGYYDIFLIDIRSGNIVYTVFKEVDFATSLADGPYSESGLGILFKRLQETPERDKPVIIDYRPYEPSYGAPAAFVGIPIFDRNEAVGILAMQIDVSRINHIMTGGGNWLNDGLGQTGETYLVGADQFMRSDARLLLEDKPSYLEMLRTLGAPESMIHQIDNYNSSILLHSVTSDAVQSAFGGATDTRIVDGLGSAPVLGSYGRLNLEGLEWSLFSEIAVSEAFAPVYTLQHNMLIWGVSLILGVSFLAIVLARYFVKPIETLAAGVRALRDGQSAVHIEIQTNDEFGELAHNFNEMVDSIRLQKEVIEEQVAENERLLLNILPAAIAQRLKEGERIADQLQQVSVIFIHIHGFAQMSKHHAASASANLLEELFNHLDEAAERFDLQRIKTIGETYMAVCGLTTARLDHALRTVNFAQAAMTLGHQRHENLTMQIGIDSGPVISGVVGSKKFQFELWGETVNIAHHIQTLAELNTILVTENVYKRVREQFNLHAAPPISHYDQEIQVYQVVNGAGVPAAATAAAPEPLTEDAVADASHRTPELTATRSAVA